MNKEQLTVMNEEDSIALVGMLKTAWTRGHRTGLLEGAIVGFAIGAATALMRVFG